MDGVARATMPNAKDQATSFIRLLLGGESEQSVLADQIASIYTHYFAAPV
jgi:hypothetical protein